MYIYWTIRDSRVMEIAPPQRWMDRALCPPDGDSAKGEEKEEKNPSWIHEIKLLCLA
jgi:hypothetical protein